MKVGDKILYLFEGTGTKKKVGDLFDGVLVLSSLSVTGSAFSFSYSPITLANAFVENSHLADGLSGSKFGRSSAVSICLCSISIF